MSEPSAEALEFVERMVSTEDGGYWGEKGNLTDIVVNVELPEGMGKARLVESIYSEAYDREDFSNTKHALSMLLDTYAAQQHAALIREVESLRQRLAAERERIVEALAGQIVVAPGGFAEYWNRATYNAISIVREQAPHDGGEGGG